MCCGNKPLEQLAKGCSIKYIPPCNGDEHTRKLVRVAIPGIPGVYTPFVHQDCVHNQVVAITNRVCGITPAPTPEGISKLRKAAKVLGSKLPKTVEEDYYHLPMRYSGSKRLRYLRATDDILSFGFDLKKHSSIKAFVKSERTDGNAKVNPDPRVIQFRDARYCVEVSRFLKPIEEHLYRLKGVSCGVARSRNVAKGLNQVERAHLFNQKFSNFSSPVVLSLDASRFDKHVGVELLQLEHSIYLASNPNPWFKALLKQQLSNRCYSSKGIRYKTAGKRMSGDMNTALGNCTIMLMMLLAFMDWCPKWDCLDDGDDVLVFIEQGSLDEFNSKCKDAFLSFGMQIKVEHVSTTPSDVEFCQSKIIRTCLGPKFVRNPLKVLSCALTGIRYYRDVHARRNLLYSIGTCELVLNLGVPILQSFSEAIRRVTSGKLNSNFLGESEARFRRELRNTDFKLTDVQPLPITVEAREDFYVAFGISPEDQVRIEGAFKTWNFNLTGDVHVVGGWNSDWVYDASPASEIYHLAGFYHA